jgi:hypothetical protein
MRKKKTTLRTRKHRQASSPQQAGLIAGEKSVPQSVGTRCALDNRSHRTHRALCRRPYCGAKVAEGSQVPWGLVWDGLGSA